MTTRNDIDSFKGHRLWTVAKIVIDASEAAKPRNSDDRNTLARAIAVATFVASFRSVDVFLFGTGRLQEAEFITGQLDAILSQINGWNQEAGMIPQTISQIDANANQVMIYVGSYHWPAARTGRATTAIAEAADSYRNASEGALSAIEEQIATASGRLNELQESAKALQTASEERAAEAMAAVSDIMAAKEDQAASTAASLQIELQSVKNAAEAQRDELLAEGERYLASLRDNYETGNDLVKQVADQSVGGGYLQFADTEMTAHGNWNKMGIAAVVAAFVYLVLTFWLFPPSDAVGAVLKLGISLSVVAFSAYAFREAGKRQRQSVEARYRALDTIALDPFSKGLDDTQRQALRYLLGERLFGSSIESAGASSRGRQVNNSVSLSIDAGTAKAVSEIITAARGIQN
jgi:hypothetical protein